MEARLVEDRYELPLYSRREIVLVRGEGMYLWDAEGRRYLDVMSNYGTSILGHAHPTVTAAIREQAARLIGCHQSFYNDARARFIEALEALLPDGLRALSFSNSGGEAVEAALTYARLATGRQAVISTERGYHGRSFGARSSLKGEPAGAVTAGGHRVPYGDLSAAERAVGSGQAALLLEPVQGESGVHPASAAYLRGLRRLCDDTGTLLIFDEVQTAFRTGRTWAFQHSGAQPDIMTLSKPLANGLPIGVTVVSDRVAASVPTGSHGSTFGGSPLVCAAGAATLEIVGAAGFNAGVTSVGDTFLAGLRSLHHPSIQAVRGVGLMLAVELDGDVAPVLREMQRRGVLAIAAGKTSIRFLPPLIMKQDQVDEVVDVLDAALRAAGREQ